MHRASSLPRPGISKRLEWLMVLRVVFVTLLLGSAIAVNVNDVESFANPSYVAIASLIIATYLATIAYALFLRLNRQLELLGYVQLVGDVLVAGGLIALTGGNQSIFAFILLLNVVNGGLVLGRRGAFVVASAGSLVVVGLLLFALGYVGEAAGTQQPINPAPIYNAIINIVAMYLVGFLAGRLVERLDEQGRGIADLQALNAHILESIASGVVTLDQERRVLSINAAAEALLGVSADQALGRPVGEIVEELAEVLEQELRNGITGRWEMWLNDAEGEQQRLIGLNRSHLTDGVGNTYGHILVLNDLTEVREMERKATRQQRLAAVGELAANIAHEIRNPLASISGSIELLEANLDTTDPTIAPLSAIVLREIERLNLLISDFLAYARMEPQLTDDAQLHRLLEDVSALFVNDEITNEIDVSIDIEALRNVVVPGDPSALRQVVWNLLRNAAQATQPGGKVTLYADINDLVSPRRVSIIVRDTGHGVVAADLEKIFTPFFTTKEDGTGLGLATVSRIVEAHGGMIDIDSEVDKGTVVHIELPLPEDASTSASHPEAPALEAPMAVNR